MELRAERVGVSDRGEFTQFDLALRTRPPDALRDGHATEWMSPFRLHIPKPDPQWSCLQTHMRVEKFSGSVSRLVQTCREPRASSAIGARTPRWLGSAKCREYGREVEGGVVRTLRKSIAQEGWENRSILGGVAGQVVEAWGTRGGSRADVRASADSLIHQSLGQEPELKYNCPNVLAQVKLKEPAEVGGSRWTIEQDFPVVKRECGLDAYETRGWTGWRHHTILSALALLLLSLQRRRFGGKRTADDRARSKGPWSNTSSIFASGTKERSSPSPSGGGSVSGERNLAINAGGRTRAAERQTPEGGVLLACRILR